MESSVALINTTLVARSKRPMVFFYIIASLIPLIILLSMALMPDLWDWLYGRPFSYPEAALEAAQRLGYDIVSTNLVERVPAAFLEPVLWMPLIYAGAPAIAAITIILLMGEKGAFKIFISRFNPFRHSTSLSRSLLFYGLLVGLMMLIRLPVFAVAGFQSVDWGNIFTLSALYLLLANALVNQGGLLEECGWHTFAFPYLQEHMRTPLAASIFLGLIWSFWHIPRDLMQWDGALLTFIAEYCLFTVGTISAAIIITYFFNQLGGSVWPAIIMHGLVNQTFDMADVVEAANVYPEFLGRGTPTLAIYAGQVIAVIFLIWRYGPQLGLHSSKQ